MSEKCIVNPERDCLGLIKAEELEKNLRDMQERNDRSHKEFYKRLADLERHNEVQDANYLHILEKLTDITEKLGDLSTRLANIEFKPAKRWESVVENIIFLVVAAVVGFVIARIGLG